jgi:hypothetical protein
MINKLLATTIAFAAATLAAGAATAAASGFTMLAGYYETRTSSPGDPAGKPVRDCLSPAEAKEKTVERWLSETTKMPNCTFSKRAIGGGRFAITGNCNNGGMKSSFSQTGTYSPTAMTMNMKMTLNAGGKPVSMDMTTVSRRIAASCPARAR